MRIPMMAACMLLAACSRTAPTPAVQADSAGPSPRTASPTPADTHPPVTNDAAVDASESTPLHPDAGDTGAIAGMLTYPSEVLPAMRVCAFELADGAARCVTTTPGQHAYRIDGVPIGDYQVLAYPREGSGAPGGYTGCVDDLSVNCTDHDLRVVMVEPGKTTHGIDPADFYAGDAGVDWPAEP